MPPSSRAAHRNFAFDFHHVFDGNRNAVQRADSMAGADCLTGSTPAPRCSMQSQKPEPDGRKRTHVNDVERLRLYRAQRELDGTLMLSRDNTRWLFNMAALGIQSRDVADRLPKTSVFAIAPRPLKQRRDQKPDR